MYVFGADRYMHKITDMTVATASFTKAAVTHTLDTDVMSNE